MSEKVVKKKRRLNRRTINKLVSIVLISVAIYIFINVGKQFHTMYTLKKQSQLVESELAILEDENAALVSTKNKLEDSNYVTTYARGAYMFSKGDEKVFYLPSSNGGSDSSQSATVEPTVEATEDTSEGSDN